MQQRRELGIPGALGATQRDIVRWCWAKAVAVTAAGQSVVAGLSVFAGLSFLEPCVERHHLADDIRFAVAEEEVACVLEDDHARGGCGPTDAINHAAIEW